MYECILEGQCVFFIHFISALVEFLLGRVSERIEDPLNLLLYRSGLHLLTSIVFHQSTEQYSNTISSL